MIEPRVYNLILTCIIAMRIFIEYLGITFSMQNISNYYLKKKNKKNSHLPGTPVSEIPKNSGFSQIIVNSNTYMYCLYLVN